MRGGDGASREAGEPGRVIGTTSGMRGGPTQGVGAKGTRGAHANMSRMSVTLEVSKLSGWLKADALCRVEGRACDAGGEVRAGRREGLWVWWRHDKRHGTGARLKAWGPRARAERT